MNKKFGIYVTNPFYTFNFGWTINEEFDGYRLSALNLGFIQFIWSEEL